MRCWLAIGFRYGTADHDGRCRYAGAGRDEGLSATRDRRRNYGKAAFGLAMLAPAFMFFVMWVFLPLAYGIYLSFTNSTLTNTPQLVGLSNYRTLWHDPLWWSSLTRTFDYVGEVVVPTFGARLRHG